MLCTNDEKYTLHFLGYRYLIYWVECFMGCKKFVESYAGTFIINFYYCRKCCSGLCNTIV